jgi:hypothetical protein
LGGGVRFSRAEVEQSGLAGLELPAGGFGHHPQAGDDPADEVAA